MAALPKQTLNISFTQGLDTKTDPFQIPMGKFLELVNTTFDNQGRLQKRNGFELFNSNLSVGNSIAAYQNELLALDGTALYSYSASQDAMTSKGTKISLGLEVEPIIRNSYEQTNPDSAIHAAGFEVYAWNDSSGGVRYSVIDSNTGQEIVSNELVSATGANPKVKAIGTYVVISYIEDPTSTPELVYRAIDSTTPTVLAAPVTIQASMTAGSIVYDAQVINTRLFFIVQSSDVQIEIFYLSNTLVKSGTTVTRTRTISAAYIFGDASNNVWFGGATTTVGNIDVFLIIYNFNLTTQAFTATIENITTSGATVTNICGIASGSNGRFFYEVQTSSELDDNYVRTNTLTGSVVGTPIDLVRSVGLASKPFIYNSSIYVTVTHDSELQPTYFVVDTSGVVAAKVAPSNGGGIVENAILPEVNSVSSNVYQLPYLFKGSLSSVNGDIFSQTGVNKANLTFGESTSSIILSDDIHLSGGILSMYDGANVVEHGFHLYPENLEITFDFFGGTLGPGVYQYSAVYEWTDNQGLIHRSAPSVGEELDLSGNNSLLFTQMNTTSGNPAVATTFTSDANEILQNKLYPGMKVSGSGITAGSTITQISNASAGNFTIGISQNATATASGVLITFTPSFPIFADTAAGSKVLSNVGINTKLSFSGTPLPVPHVPFVATITAGSPVAVVDNPAYLRVGMRVEYQTLSGSTSRPLITNISGKNVTLSSNFSEDRYCTLYAFVGLEGTTTTGNATITGVPSYIFPLLFVGQVIYSYQNIRGWDIGTYEIVSFNAGAGTVTLNDTADHTGAIVVSDMKFQPATELFMQVGQELTGTGITAGSYVTEITPLSSSVTISELATATDTEVDVTIDTVMMPILQLPTLRVTAKKDPAPPVNIAVYRTQANETTFYRSSSITDPIINDTSIDDIPYSDFASDALINGNELLYTTGGVVENIAAPAVSAMTIYKSRLMVLYAENRNTVGYSKQVVQNTPVEMSDIFTMYVAAPNAAEGNSGETTAIFAMDDKLILFKPNSIDYVIGNGPDNTGANNDFSDPIFVTASVGCNNQRSLVLIPKGLMFQSSHGIWLLGRDMSVSYIGADVEIYTDAGNVTSAIRMPNTTQVRFTLDSGVTLMYDYFYDQWGTFNNPEAVSSAIFEDCHTYINSAGDIYKETPGLYLDDTDPVLMSFRTGWINLAGIQGFERFYFMFLLGRYLSPFTLSVGLAYDYQSVNSQTITVTPDANPIFEARVFPQQQKCESFQLHIQENDVGTPGAGLTLSGMNLVAGIKKGYRTSTAARSSG